MAKYAVLISGAKAESGYDEFWNDVVLLREALVKNDFLEVNVYILYGDGRDYFNSQKTKVRYRPHPTITTYAANHSNVLRVLKGLAAGTNGLPKLTGQDMLFVWTFDHGDSWGGNFSLGLEDVDLPASEFASLINNVPCEYRVICMQQCFSGGFIPALKDSKNVVLTACKKDEVAWSCDDPIENEESNGISYRHGEFNYHLFSALTGKTVDGTPVTVPVDSRGYVTLRKLFSYIKTHNSRTNEHAQYNDGPLKIGKKSHLK